MRKIMFIIISIIFSLSANAQEENPRVLLKFGKHQDFYRFVFISEEFDIIHSSSVVLQKDEKLRVSFSKEIQIEFEGRILQTEDTIRGIKFYKKNGSFIFSTSDIKEIKVFKYENPYKIVIDAYFNQESIEEKPQIKGAILIDAGHGGKQEGIVVNGQKEKDISLFICKELAAKLAQKGINTSLTRASDEDLSIKKRLNIANNLKPRIFLSIHVSSGDYFTIYTSPLKKEKTDDGSKISFIEEKFINNFTKIFKLRFNEQIYQEKIPVTILKNSISPALMIELPRKVSLLDKTYNNKIIDALTQVVIETLSTKEKTKEDKK